MNGLRWVVFGALLVLAMVLQVSVFTSFAWDGIGPDLVLLVVVAGALARGGQFGIILGFAGGVLLDLAPPADHTAGRWALALLVVGYVAGRMRQDARPTPAAALATVAACSFVGTSIYALSGLVLGEHVSGFGQMAEVIGVSLLWNLLLTPLVLPGVMALMRRLEPERALVR